MNEFLDTLSSALNLDEKPVSFREFVTGKDYCDNHEVYEYWLSEGDSLDDSVSELILDGSLGGGKTTFSGYVVAYRVYALFLKGNPQSQLGLSKDTEIYMLYFSVSMPMAKKSGFKQLYNIFKNCKWFRDNHPVNENLLSSIEFDNQFHIDFASSTGHQIGLTVWGYILDEANFRSGVGQGNLEEYTEVTELYTQLMDRLMSRFSRPDGTVNGLAILISSASYQSSFVEQRKNLLYNDPHTKIITSTAYKVKPWQYSKETFRVFIGRGEVEPRIVSSKEEEEFCLRQANAVSAIDAQHLFRDVPLNLKKSFETNIYRALQNHCGIPTMMQGRFMSNLKYLYASYLSQEEIKPVLQSFTLQASTEDDTELIEYLIPGNIQFAERPHSLFLDLSVQSDTGGLSCFRYDGKDELNNDIHTRVFLLKIQPPEYPNQTSIAKVRNFIIDLSEYLNIVAVSSDQYQSTQLRQEIAAELNLEDIRMSLDSSDLAYVHWQRALVDGRIKQIKDEKLEKECQEALHDFKRHRVIKSKKSSDDVLQVEVGGFYLSDTVGKNNGGDISEYYSNKRLNLVGTRSQEKLLQQLGYIK